MLQSDVQYTLPSSDELIDSDDFPVDNEDQNFIPNVLLFLLEYIWKHRQDWYFAVDMGVYHIEVYKLVNDTYELQIGEPFWMPEIGLGIGRCRLPDDPLDREVLSWYDAKSDRYPNEAETERQRAEQLAERLRQLGEEV